MQKRNNTPLCHKYFNNDPGEWGKRDARLNGVRKRDVLLDSHLGTVKGMVKKKIVGLGETWHLY